MLSLEKHCVLYKMKFHNFKIKYLNGIFYSETISHIIK